MEYSYKSDTDRVHCAGCMWQALLEDDKDEFECFFSKYG